MNRPTHRAACAAQGAGTQSGGEGRWGGSRGALRGRGGCVDGNPRRGTARATTGQVRDGGQGVTDGPFAETKEQLGGYYIVETDSLDEALQWAAKIPGARYGSIEVRPVLPMTVEPSAG